MTREDNAPSVVGIRSLTPHRATALARCSHRVATGIPVGDVRTKASAADRDTMANTIVATAEHSATFIVGTKLVVQSYTCTRIDVPDGASR